MKFFDLHSDTPYECFNTREDFYVNRLAISGIKSKLFDVWYQVFAVWIKDDCERPFQLYKSIITDFKEKIKNSPDKPIPFFSVEGGAVLENDIHRLEVLRKDEICILTLTWNGENEIAGGVKAEKGLTDFGRRVIEKMNSLKMGCDLSHLNDKSFIKALEFADFPIATHSNCREILNHPRNLTKEQIGLLAEKNGIIGLCFYPEFLGQDVMQKLYENIFFLCDAGFENQIAMGSDFDGAKMAKDLDNIEKVPNLYAFLKAKGLQENLLEKIFYQNAYNFIAKLC